MHLFSRTRQAGLLVLVALVAAMLTGLASTAWAAPEGPTMGVDELQTALDSHGGTLPAHFKTILKGDNDDIVEIDATVTALTSGFTFGNPDMASLILFESSDTDLQRVGGIASGMSGSPLYVDVDGTDYLVGAVSYGDIFTLNGQGLATPIDAMSNLEGYQAPVGIRSLSAPVLTEQGVKDRVILAPKATPELEELAADGAIVAKPLSTFYVTGIPAGGKVAKALTAHLAAAGIDAKVGSGLSSMESTYSAEFEGGSAIAALAARGDLWAGGVGTVTYRTDDTVLAFGHPMNQSGDTGLFMSNAIIDGVWTSSLSPYKLARPAAVRGTITQDRSAGILGVDGLMPEVTPVTATCVNTSNGKSASTSVTIPRAVMNSSDWEYWGLSSMAAYVASSRVIDQSRYPGSALVTTTVQVSDGTVTYDIVRTNIVDDDDDITAAVIDDVDEIVSLLQDAGTNGIAEPDILSVNVESTVSARRALSEIVSVDPTAPLKSGENTVTISYLKHGMAATQTVDVTLTIPAGTPVTGRLSAESVWGSDMDYFFDEEEMFLFEGDGDFDYGYIDRSTVKDVVDVLNDYDRNDLLTVSFQPEAYLSEFDFESGLTTPSVPYKAIEATRAIENAYLVGAAGKSNPEIDLKAEATTVSYGGYPYVMGELMGAENESDIVVTQLRAGESTPTTVGTITVDPEEGFFEKEFGPVYKTTTYTFSYAGDDDTLPTAKSIKINVQASNSLKASAYTIKKGRTSTLTATIKGSGSSGKVYFERYSSSWGMWVPAGSGATKTLVAGAGKATYSVKPTATSKYRARFVAGTGSTNASKTSSTVTIKVTR